MSVMWTGRPPPSGGRLDGVESGMNSPDDGLGNGTELRWTVGPGGPSTPCDSSRDRPGVYIPSSRVFARRIAPPSPQRSQLSRRDRWRAAGEVRGSRAWLSNPKLHATRRAILTHGPADRQDAAGTGDP